MEQKIVILGLDRVGQLTFQFLGNLSRKLFFLGRESSSRTNPGQSPSTPKARLSDNPTRKKQNTSMKTSRWMELTKFKYSNFYTRIKCNKKVVGGKMKLID